MIPSPVLCCGMLVMFGIVSVQGIQILNSVDFKNNEHNLIIAAVSIAAGVGFNGTNLFDSLPTNAQMFLTNGIVIATLCSITLNLLFNGKESK